MSDIVDVLRKGLEEHEMLAMGHRLFDDAATAINQLRGKLQTVLEAHDRMRDNLLNEKFAVENELDRANVEIEELRAKDQHWNEHLRTAQDEIKRLTACLKWEQNWLERVGTHAPGCWQWGPGHYMCAVRHIEEMERG